MSEFSGVSISDPYFVMWDEAFLGAGNKAGTHLQDDKAKAVGLEITWQRRARNHRIN